MEFHFVAAEITNDETKFHHILATVTEDAAINHAEALATKKLHRLDFPEFKTRINKRSDSETISLDVQKF